MRGSVKHHASRANNAAPDAASTTTHNPASQMDFMSGIIRRFCRAAVMDTTRGATRARSKLTRGGQLAGKARCKIRFLLTHFTGQLRAKLAEEGFHFVKFAGPILCIDAQ